MSDSFDIRCLAWRKADRHRIAVLHWQGIRVSKLQEGLVMAIKQWGQRTLEGQRFIAKHGTNLNVETLAELLPLGRGEPLYTLLGNNGVHDLEIMLVDDPDGDWRLNTPLVSHETVAFARVNEEVRKHLAEMSGLDRT